MKKSPFRGSGISCLFSFFALCATFLFAWLGGTFSARADWNIVWADEFNGNAVNPAHWVYEIGNGSGGWGNQELEYYTSNPTNVYVANGLLHIVAQKQTYMGYQYTSTRMKTAGHFSKKYGRFEFRAKFPQGQGFWPAMWLMPEDSVYGGWASSGEIDVMESRGNIPTTVLGTLHFGGAWPNQDQSHGPSFNFTGGDSITNFHTYMLQWTSNSVSWFIDGQNYETQTSWWSSSNPTNLNIHNPFPAPFDQPFYIILNLAVGGQFVGSPDATTVFPGDMQVDYVRVYDITAPLKLSVTSTNSTGVLLGWPTNIVCHLQSRTNLSDTNWVDVAGASNPFLAPSKPGNPTSFYRLTSP